MKRQRLLTLSLLMLTLVGLAVLVQPVAPAEAGNGGGGVQGGGGRSLSISGDSFVPDASTTAYRTDATDGVVLLADAAPHNNMQAPINLPDGAVINSIEFFYYDNQAPGYMLAHLMRGDPGLGSSTYLIGASSPAGAVGYGSDLESLPIPEVVNNSRYNYRIEIFWSADSVGATGAKLMGIKIQYGEP